MKGKPVNVGSLQVDWAILLMSLAIYSVIRDFLLALGLFVSFLSADQDNLQTCFFSPSDFSHELTLDPDT